MYWDSKLSNVDSNKLVKMDNIIIFRALCDVFSAYVQGLNIWFTQLIVYDV